MEESKKKEIISRLLKTSILPLETTENGTFYFRKLTGPERETYFGVVQSDPSPTHLYSRLIALSLCDDSGKRVFDGDDDVAIESVTFMIQAPLLQLLYEASHAFNFTKIDDAKKGLPKTTNLTSSSPLPVISDALAGS